MSDIGCCQSVPEHVNLFRCGGVSLAISVVSLALACLAILALPAMPVIAMGSVFGVASLLMILCLSVLMCCITPNKGRAIALYGSTAAAVLTVVGILLILAPGDSCDSFTCHAVSCDACKGDACKVETAKAAWTGVPEIDSKGAKGDNSVLCSAIAFPNLTTSCGKYYCNPYDDRCTDAKADSKLTELMWGWKDQDDCYSWVNDNEDIASFAWLLLFIVFAVLVLASCCTAGFAYKTIEVDENRSKV